MLSVSSIVGILTGVISSKVTALLIGPQGLGLRALLQTLLGISTLVVPLGIGAGMVRMLPEAIAREDQARIGSLRRACWLLFWLFSGIAISIMILEQRNLSGLIIGSSSHSREVVIISFAVFFTVAAGLHTSILNAYHKISALARLGILSTIAVSAISIALIWRLRLEGVPYSILAGSLIAWALAQYSVFTQTPRVKGHPGLDFVIEAGRDLIKFGTPYTASMIVGTGTQILLPILVVHQLGLQGAGIYRASTNIAVTYLGFLLASMGQDYYPRISAVAQDASHLRRLVNDQQTVMMLIAVPLVLAALALTPIVIPLLYSVAFSAAGPLLRWQLLGDLFKLSSWTLSFVILVRSGSKTYFLTELFGGTALLVFTWILMRRFGVPGLGMAYLASYASYYLAVWAITTREIDFRWSRKNVALMISALFAGGIIQATSGAMTESWHLLVAGLVFILWSSVAITAVLTTRKTSRT